ncbi:Retrovirus-related Pol polyprotein from transposon RE1 [Vitis vinifera]|uniref:Retrovirus-related Pol polyprotein from transposon RE1 n=1 Tax=Vitis vinifera TaxID=29760 RepID=A0A438G5V2_VITVI|nr:Retrovirus-related Pol polyprotein from transposon RE1 [Vitis vinifera]
MRCERFRGRKFTSRRDLSKKESSSHGDKEKWEEKRDLTYFKCKKLGHIKYDCPLYKSEAKRRMKKAMMATWSESEESSEEENEKEVANMCLMAIDDLNEGSKNDKWFLDSGCSRHMTRDESKFAFLTKRKGGYVTFRDNSKGRIIGQDNIGLETSMEKLQIENKRQQEEVVKDPKKEESPLALPPPQQVQGESSQDLPKDWKFVINQPQDQIIVRNEHDGRTYLLPWTSNQATKGRTLINQAKYIRDLLKRFNMEETKTMKTPMSSSIKLDMDEKGKPVNSTMYRGMIGSLLYLTASRLDIMYSVCLCARFQSCPKESHLSAVKRILRYLKGTMDIGLWYPKGDNFELIGYSDADFAGCKVERKSTSDTCHFLGHSLVSWHSNNQNSVALSTAEAEYIAVGLCCAQILWMKQTLGFNFWECFFSAPLSSGLVQLHLCAPRASGEKRAPPGLRASALLSHISLSRRRLPERRGMTRPFSVRLKIINATSKSSPRGKSSRGEVSISPNFSTSGLRDHSVGWDGLLSTMKGVEIKLSPESIYHILDIPSVGLRVYEAKAWPIVPRFKPREAVQRRRIHVGYLIMMHMISCVENTTRVLSYDRFLTRVFKDAGVDLSRETDFKAPISYDTYDEQFLGRMKFEKAPNGS